MQKKAGDKLVIERNNDGTFSFSVTGLWTPGDVRLLLSRLPRELAHIQRQQAIIKEKELRNESV